MTVDRGVVLHSMSDVDLSLARRHEVPRGKTQTKVGFYGCAGKVVRLEATGEFPRALRIKCPACGHEHVVRPAWRKKVDALDKGKDAIQV